MSFLSFKRGGRRIASKLVAPSRTRQLLGWTLVLAPLVYSAVGVARNGPPTPLNHDAFSYLFAGETFAQGRITNPPHPLWEFFETFHILSTPTRVSKFPVAQGLMLAVGRVVFSEPWVGILLSLGLMLAALYWALLAWMPPHWAWLGTALASIHFGANHYWIDSYWGGAAAAAGGCLLFGVFGRVRRRPLGRSLVRYGLVTAFGLSILANSRPWEGLLLAIAVLGWILGVFLFSERSLKLGRGRCLAAFFVPCLAVMSLTLFLMAYYNSRTTGSWQVMPYVVYQAAYSTEKIFPWESKPPPPEYNHDVMREFFTRWEPSFQAPLASDSAVENITARLSWELRIVAELMGSPTSVVIVLVFLPYLARNPRSRPVVLILAAVTLGFLLQRYYNPHYQSHLLAGFVLLKILTLRRIAHTAAETSASALGAVLLVFADAALGWTLTSYRPSSCCVETRPLVMAQLESRPGLDLVVMRYSPDHSPHCEWVYNEPDMDGAEVVWAREMTPERNCELTRYFNEREVWLLEPDADDPGPKPAPDWCGSPPP